MLSGGVCVVAGAAHVTVTLTLSALSPGVAYDAYAVANAIIPPDAPWEPLTPATPTVVSFSSPPAAPELASLSVSLPDGTPLTVNPAVGSGATFFALADALPVDVSALNVSATASDAATLLSFVDARSDTSATSWGGALNLLWLLPSTTTTATLSLASGTAPSAPRMEVQLHARRVVSADASDATLLALWADLRNGVLVNASCAAGQAWPVVCDAPPCVRGCGVTAGVLVLPSTTVNVTLTAMPRAPGSRVTVLIGRDSFTPAAPDFAVVVDTWRMVLMRTPLVNVTVTSPNGTRSLSYTVLFQREGPGVYPGWQPTAAPPGQLLLADVAGVEWGTLPDSIPPHSTQGMQGGA